MSDKAIKILHVEDDSTDALLMQEILHNEVGLNQFDIVHVDSLKDALKELCHKGYDAVLLDLNLSDVCGVDNVDAIKEENPNIPVIVLSGVDDDRTALQAIDRGAQEYLVKGHCDGKVIRLALHSSIKRKEVERRLFKQANYDDLTGLANRRMFEEYLERTLAKASRWKRDETIMFIDLDNFKQVNDALGHAAGNALLKEVSIRMTSLLRSSDIVARYGGDEFIVLLDQGSSDLLSGARQVATKLVYALNAPFEYAGRQISCSASIGVAFYPDSGKNYIELMRSADQAMYQAKQAGGAQYKIAEA